MGKSTFQTHGESKEMECRKIITGKFEWKKIKDILKIDATDFDDIVYFVDFITETGESQFDVVCCLTGDVYSFFEHNDLIYPANEKSLDAVKKNISVFDQIK